MFPGVLYLDLDRYLFYILVRLYVRFKIYKWDSLNKISSFGIFSFFFFFC